MPCRTIVNNAAIEDGAVIVGKLMENHSMTDGFNAANGTFVNMFEAGIIDPKKVVRTALVDASSVAALMMTAEAFITDLPAEAGAGGGGMPGGMPGGGMGGMPGGMGF